MVSAAGTATPGNTARPATKGQQHRMGERTNRLRTVRAGSEHLVAYDDSCAMTHVVAADVEM